MGSWKIRIVLPETVQFSTCFTLHAICLTLTLLAKWLTELSLHPSGLREILVGLMEFFSRWFGACWAYYMFQSQVVTLVLFPEVTQVLPLMCMNLESNLLQSSEGFEVRYDFRRSVCAHARTHTHTEHKHVFKIIQMCCAKQGSRMCIIADRQDVVLRVHELTWAETIAATQWINRFLCANGAASKVI